MPRTKSASRQTARFAVALLSLAAIIVFGVRYRSLKAIPEVAFPTPKLPVPNAFDTFVAAGKAYVPPLVPVDDLIDPREPPGGAQDADYKRIYPVAERDAWLLRNKRSRALARQGLKQAYRHPFNRSARTPLSHLPGFRKVARLLAVECHAQISRGDWPSAANSALDAVQMGATIPRGAPLLVAFAGYNIQAIGRRALWDILPHLDLATTERVAVRLDAIAKNGVPFADTLQTEKWASQALLIEMMKTGGWQKAIYVEDSALRFRVKTLLMNYRTMSRNDAAFFDRLIAVIQRPGGATAPVMPPECSLSDPFLCRIAMIFIQARTQWALCETGNTLLRTAVALQAYHLKTGHYPATLRELTPLYLHSVPVDPFGKGEPLRYSLKRTPYDGWVYRKIRIPAGNWPAVPGAKATGHAQVVAPDEWMWKGSKKAATTGYTLYSIGPDATDNRGTPARNPQIAGQSRYDVTIVSQGDFVAGVNS